jgi:excisionase family DNA binding protein
MFAHHGEATKYLTKSEAAEYLGVTVKTIDRKIASGDIPAYRFGPKLIRVKREDLDAALTRVEVA